MNNLKLSRKMKYILHRKPIVGEVRFIYRLTDQAGRKWYLPTVTAALWLITHTESFGSSFETLPIPRDTSGLCHWLNTNLELP